jgi:shikimate dehydrogenase
MTAALRDAAVRRAAVLGSPIAHSLSPVLHRAAYAHLGLPWTYDALECTADGLAAFVAGLGPDWVGLSLTMPLKAAVLALLDEIDPVALRAGAANTVLLGGGRRFGSNTDVPGMAAALAECGVVPGEEAGGRASILGAGATARSALVSLADAGWSAATVYARTPDRTGAIAGLRQAVAGTPLDLVVVPWSELLAPGSGGLAASLVVSTVPAGAADGLVGLVPASPGTLLDVVYAPWPTPLAKAWAVSGGLVVGGLDLLVHQAVLQVVLMTGTHAPLGELVDVLREAGVAALTDPGTG